MVTDRPAGRVRRIFASLGLVLGGKAGAGIMSLGYLLLATRYLGPKDYGVLVLVHAYVTTVCGVIEFPSWQAIVRYGAEADRDGQAHRLSRLLRFGAKVELAGGALAVISAMALVPFVGPHLGWSPKAMAFAPYYAFAVLGAVRSTPSGYLQLCGRFDLLGLHNLVQPTVRLIGTLVVIACGWGVKSFLFAWLLAALAEFAAMWGLGLWMAAKRLGSAIVRPEPGRVTDDNTGIWRFMLASNADVTLGDLTGRVAPLVIGWVMGPAMAGLFAVAQRATVILAQPAQILGNASYAELAHIVAGGYGGRALRQTLLKVVGIAVLAAVPVVLIVGIFPTQIIRLMAGPAFGAAAGVMIALVAARAVSLIGPPCTSALTALGHPARSMCANLLSSFAFLPLLPWLLTTFGLMGAGIQAVAQAVVANGLLAVLVWRTSGR
jgi:O-antigen/teichoic acid export membrane protein